MHYETLESWQAATGWDVNSIQISCKPDTIWVDLRVNKYEPNQAHLIIYNWPENDTINIDMNDLWPENEILEDGQSYEYRIVNIEDIWGEPITEGLLGDETIILPILGKYVPEFACYLVTREIKNFSNFFE